MGENAAPVRSSVLLTGRLVKDFGRRLYARAEEYERWMYEACGLHTFLVQECSRRQLSAAFEFRSAARRAIREDLLLYAFNVFSGRRLYDPVTAAKPTRPKCPELLTESFIRRWKISEAAAKLSSTVRPRAAGRCVDALVRGFDDSQITKTISAVPFSIFESGGDGAEDIRLNEEREAQLRGAAEVVRYQVPNAIVVSRSSETRENVALPLDRLLVKLADEYREHRQGLEATRAEWRELREKRRPKPRSPLRARTTPTLAALDNALRGTRGRWKLIAGLAHDFLELERSPNQIRLLVKNHRDLAKRARQRQQTG
jgi:hypothetical protein